MLNKVIKKVGLSEMNMWKGTLMNETGEWKVIFDRDLRESVLPAVKRLDKERYYDVGFHCCLV